MAAGADAFPLTTDYRGWSHICPIPFRCAGPPGSPARPIEIAEQRVGPSAARPDTAGAVSMARIPHVALMVETSSIYGRRLLEGITRYLRSHRPWSIFLEQRELDSEPPRWLETWRGDGIISRWSRPNVTEALRGADVAAVDLCDRRGSFGLPRITSDDRAIGILAAEHLLERGFRSFGFCGFVGELWVLRRREAFLDTLARSGYSGRVYESHWSGPG